MRGSDIHDARETEGSPGDGEREVPHLIVYNLVMIELPQGVGPGDFTSTDPQNGLIVLHIPMGFLDRQKLRPIDSRDCVFVEYRYHRLSVDGQISLVGEATGLTVKEPRSAQEECATQE
jgi:hypothetical protein